MMFPYGLKCFQVSWCVKREKVSYLTESIVGVLRVGFGL